jgi:hypothetical protein
VEKKEVLRFAILKMLNPEDIHTELFSVSESNTLAVATVYKWCQHFVNGRTELYDGPWSGRPLRNDPARAPSAMLQ